MAKCPGRVRINGYKWRLLYTKKAWSDLGHEDTLGVTYAQIRLMVARPGATESQCEAQTVLHEVLHGVFHESFPNPSKKRGQEATVSGIEAATYAMIRDNPRLVAYLQDPDPL